MNVSLDVASAATVRALLDEGHFEGSTEVVAEALRAMQRERTRQAELLGAVRAKLAEGLAQAREGQVKPGDQFFSGLMG